MFSRTFNAASAVIFALSAMAANLALANPVTISNPFMNLENRGINSLGFSSGYLLRVGATSVTPNGDAGTTGIATTTDLITGNPINHVISFVPNPVVPNFFQSYMLDNAALHGPWTLKFTNGVDTASRTVSLPAGTTQAPFVESITLSGTSDSPTFGWAPPTGTTVNGYRVNIFDKSLINFDASKGPINSGLIVSRNIAADVKSYTVDPAHFNIPGYAFALDKNYSIEISLVQSKDGSGNLSNSNIAAIARAYADFTPHAGGGLVVNLPVVRIDGVYQFNMAIEANKLYYIDPEVAIGYIYAIGAGDPNFRSVVLPTNIGDGLYDLWGDDGMGGWTLLADDLAGGSMFDFGVDGLSRFRVTDIETGAGLDPKNTTAFVTGLTFTGSGKFTGTQAPITVNISNVPEAPSLALLALGLAVAGWQQRKNAKLSARA